MSNHPRLPPELFDCITDHLQDNPETLTHCCLVSKSWVPRARKHLFARIELQSGDHVKSWKETFPDPANSPARHARTLTICCAPEDINEGYWIRSFSRVNRLILSPDPNATASFFTPLRGLSRSLRSLEVAFHIPHPHVFNLICSLPLLENLSLAGEETADGEDHVASTVVPATSPPLTGSLELLLFQRNMVETPRLLLGLPGGLHFRTLELSWFCEGDLRQVADLVAACSETLETLCVIHASYDVYTPSISIDLSKAKKLKKAAFMCRTMCCDWITMTLETITPEHLDLQYVTIHTRFVSTNPVPGDDASIVDLGPENPAIRWLDLDRLLVQYWDKYSIFTRVVCPRIESRMKGMKKWAKYLFPEMTKRGIIDLDEAFSGSSS